MELKLSDDVEVIFVDDGSKPSHKRPYFKLNFNFRFIYTNDFRNWTQPKARNIGVKEAKGEYVLCTDIDHIVMQDAIDKVREDKYDVVRFKREVGILDERGQFTQDLSVLQMYGYNREKLRISAHGNSYIFKRDLYLELGGVSEANVGRETHPNREEKPLKRAVRRLAEEGKIKLCDGDDRPTIYLIPNGRFCGDKDADPLNLFHNLERMTR
jgi:glycosyltransferase involved in cell wall biosynthesis